LKLNQLGERVNRNHAAQLQWEPGVATAIVARCHEVESGARNIDHIITQNLLPAIASEVLAKIAASEQFTLIALSIDLQGGFKVSLKNSAADGIGSASGSAGAGGAGGSSTNLSAAAGSGVIA
jgi:type VI secretion system protein VasG